MIIIFNYHYVRDNYNYAYNGINGITVERFKDHISYLASYCNFISINDLQSDSYLELFLNKDLNVIITFDDGLSEQYINCLPILKYFKIKPTFFINTASIYLNKLSNVHILHYLLSSNKLKNIMINIEKFLNNNNFNLMCRLTDNNINKAYKYGSNELKKIKFLFNYALKRKDSDKLLENLLLYFADDEFNNYFKQLYMNNSNLKYLANNKYLGSHGHSHLNYGLSNKVDINNDILKFKSLVKKNLNIEIKSFSYPYGTKYSYNKNIINQLKEHGYTSGFTVERAYNNDPSKMMYLSRFDCNDLEELIKKNFKLKEISKLYNSSTWEI
jgi:peptidoglycan/xylan/chitin deacetylase (PgdA/CDA1 family)